MSLSFVCPICASPLEKEEHSAHCPNGHCFDYAKEGYVNLLPVQQKNSLMPGDDKDMVEGRSAFLQKGYYAPLQNALLSLVKKYGTEDALLLDCGCGEGYYTNAIAREHLVNEVLGIDISKLAVKKASKHGKEVSYAVASSFHLPLADHSVQLLLNCFSPLVIEEFSRVIKPGGYFFYVVPGARHLWQMKEVLYDAPYENEEKLSPYEGFSYVDVITVEDTIHLVSQEDIHALFAMTPYAWKTEKKDAEKLLSLSQLTTEISFHIHVFRCEE